MTGVEGRQPNLRMRFPVVEFVGSCLLSIYYSFTDIYMIIIYLETNGEHISLQKTQSVAFQLKRVTFIQPNVCVCLFLRQLI